MVEEYPDEAECFAKFKEWEYQPELTVDQHRAILRDSHHTASLFHINLLNEYLALVPGLTWPDPDDERINLPGMIRLQLDLPLPSHGRRDPL